MYEVLCVVCHICLIVYYILLVGVMCGVPPPIFVDGVCGVPRSPFGGFGVRYPPVDVMSSHILVVWCRVVWGSPSLADLEPRGSARATGGPWEPLSRL